MLSSFRCCTRRELQKDLAQPKCLAQWAFWWWGLLEYFFVDIRDGRLEVLSWARDLTCRQTQSPCFLVHQSSSSKSWGLEESTRTRVIQHWSHGNNSEGLWWIHFLYRVWNTHRVDTGFTIIMLVSWKSSIKQVVCFGAWDWLYHQAAEAVLTACCLT